MHNERKRLDPVMQWRGDHQFINAKKVITPVNFPCNFLPFHPILIGVIL